MRRILINSVQKQEQEYVAFMRPLCEAGLKELRAGIIRLNTPQDVYVMAALTYIDTILKDVKQYLCAKPNIWKSVEPSILSVGLNKLYNHSFNYKEVNKKDKSGTIITKKKSDIFYKILVQYMKYENARKKLGPLHNKMGIYACVYCNAAPTVSSRSGDDVFYELDHFRPKSQYPYLCVNFYNLQPSCAACNKRKLANTNKDAFDLYTDDESQLASPFRFVPRLTKYDGTDENFEIKFMGINKTTTPLSTDNNDLFHIEKRYQAYNNIVNQLYKDFYRYPECVIDAWKIAMGISITKRELEECLFRFSMAESMINSEILLKLKQDTIKQMEEIGLFDKYII